ncbi:GGDEF domain-containing protein [Massilia yuzhufengensis]|uniref:diguanylate cyclase n=1 Tax=Massilia yuzhufengensis TaxID=1164594 RepID=A0A1I1EZ97_9BURK|nr:GGDEF domain-containing protein [Massilia yuzhufengensis]SFB91982.1 diguanylate cyclase (GGDEF) domain-containing protein [Massilia yuzhufengensis]
MSLLRRLVELLYGSDRALRRMLQYWAATCVLYVVCIGLVLVQVSRGMTDGETAHRLIVFGSWGALAFYALIRASARLGLKPDQLAVSQAVFSMICTMCAYAISGPLRAAVLVMTVLIIAFCMFAARPRQTLLLSIGSLAGAGGVMYWLQAHDPLRYPPMTELLTFGYLAGALLATALLSGEMSKLRSRLKRQRRELSDALETIRVLATVDELTSLVNRRRMHEVLEAEERRQPDENGTCIALLDIDFFKQVNDQFGHAAGDAVLRSFSIAARASLRANDVLARWGGEEFLLLLPDAAPEDARHVLERMAERVHGMPVPGVQGRRISFSAGLATRRAGEPFADAIHRADNALYQAKEAGRDRIVLA